MMKNEETQNSDAFSEGEHSSRSFDYAHGNKAYYICFNDLCKPIEKYIYFREKHPFTCCPAANLELQTYEKNQ